MGLKEIRERNVSISVVATLSLFNYLLRLFFRKIKKQRIFVFNPFLFLRHLPPALAEF